MPLELQDLKKMHDKSYTQNEIIRERAADDLVFYWVTQWDDHLLSESNLNYRGEFNIVRKAGRQIISDLNENPVQVHFEPINETGEDAAETLDGIYRTSDGHNASVEAYAVGDQEAVVCGVGAWEILTEYQSMRTDDRNQVIVRRPITEANNTVFWDPNAKRLDKSDAMYCSVLTGYSEDGYIDLVKELTGEVIDSVDASSFKNPEISYVFPWIGGQGKVIHIVSFFHREKYKTKMFTFESPHGEVSNIWEDRLEKGEYESLLSEGFKVVVEKEVERYKVTKYIASGERILSEEVIAGEHITIIPQYGERAFIEDAEHYEGVTRLAKDPQRLRNFIMSYLADIASKSPRQKPIFHPEQIQGFTDMYAENGPDNNYPYLLANMTDANGNPLPGGPVGMMPEQKIPDSVGAMLEQTRIAVEDVANPGLPQNIADPDVSGKAVLALQARLDMQSQVYQENRKHAKRRDGEVYASIAAEIYDVPRSAKATLFDGTIKDIEIMEPTLNEETGEPESKNDLYNSEYLVYSVIGPSYSSQREQTLEQLTALYQNMAPGDPKRSIVELEIIAAMPGTGLDDFRDYARMELIVMGIKKPETDEEKQALAQAQAKGKEPSPEMVLAQAEMKKGQAMELEAKVRLIDVKLKAENEKAKRRTDAFEAETDRFDTQIDAQEADATINYKRADALNKELDALLKVQELNMPKMIGA